LPVLADVGTNGGSITHILYNGGFENSITLVNTGSSAASATLNFFAENGAPLAVPLFLPQTSENLAASSSFNRTIPAYGSLLIQTVGQDALPTTLGSAQLVTNGNVSGFGIFRWTQPGQEASVPMETRSASTYVMPFDDTNGLSTGIAIAGVSGPGANIPVIIRDDTGVVLSSTAITLPAQGHASFMLPNTYPSTVGTRGSVEFTAPTGVNISVIGLRATPAGNLTTIPVLARNAASGGGGGGGGGGPAPVITSFTGAPGSFNRGQSGTLSWNVTGATSVSIDQGVGNAAANGSTIVAPLATTTYTLTATNSSGTTTATVTLLVNPPASSGTITLNPTVQYQKMAGWEAVSQSGEIDCPGFNSYKSTLFDQAINDLGINRLRLELTTNSNGTTFNLTALDANINAVVLPLRQLSQARGEHLWLNVTFVGKNSLSGSPTQYAQQVVATYQHLQSTFGFVPDSWEAALEPTNVTPGYTPSLLADAIVATGTALSNAGFTTYIVAPSTAGGANNAVPYIDSMVQHTSSIFPYLKEFSYHRYDTTDPYLSQVVSRAQQYHINTSMLEHGSGDYNELHTDLKFGNVSAWEQFTLAYCTSDNGYQYYPISGSTVSIGSRTKYLRQYFKYIRSGAMRMDALSQDSRFDPVAFLNTNGKFVVVVKATASGTFSVSGLPGGTYGIMYTTDSQYNVNLADITVAAGSNLSTSIPASGVLTIYGK
jgi:hypothetical protein